MKHDLTFTTLSHLLKFNMASINLSFKEWPFPIQKEMSLTRSLNVPQIKEKSNNSSKPLLHLNIARTHTSALYSSNLNLSKQNSLSQSNSTLNDFGTTPLPIKRTKKNQWFQLSAWGRCGLFACAFNSTLSIYSNDCNGCLSPMFMFSPFNRFDKRKIVNKNQEREAISAIGWANGHLQPSIPKPIFAVASEKGHIAIYDFSTKEMLAHTHFNDKIISLHWSSRKINRFYVGSYTGHLYVCEINNKCIQIKQTFDFNAYSSDNSENVLKSVDFITEDDVDGSIISIASKDGSVGYILNANLTKKQKLQVYQKLPFQTCLKSSDNQHSLISFFEFYPNDQDFIIIATNGSTFLFSILKGVLIPFIQTPNCKFISLIDNSNNQVIVGDGTGISIWSLVDHSWVRSSLTSFAGKLNMTEILSYSKLNSKIILTTASNWLTEVEIRRNKIFITKRILLLNKMPIDYDFGNGSIAFLMNDNSISFTEYTPESVIKPQFGHLSNLQTSEKINHQQFANIEESPNNDEKEDGMSQLFHAIEDSNDDDEIPINNDDLCDQHSYQNKESTGSGFVRSSSMTFEIDSDSSRAFKHIFDSAKKDSFIISDIESPIPRSKSDLLNDNSELNKFHVNDAKLNSDKKCGNSNSFILSFNIKSDSQIQSIFWVSSQNVIALSENSVFNIDLQTRTISEPLKDNFDSKCNIITQAFFSKSRKIMCIVFNHKTACFLKVEQNVEIINSIDFSQIIKKDYNNLYGCISPKEDQVVFASKNFLFFAKLNEVSSNIKEVYINLDYNASFVSWKNRGIIIGTENGSVFIISKKSIDNIYDTPEISRKDCTIIQDSARFTDKKKNGSIKLVSPCANDSFVVIDINGRGTIISGDFQQTINGIIEAFKLSSKDTFLVRFKNDNKLIAIDAIGDFTPCPPPCFYVNQTNNIFFNSNKKINFLEYGKESDNSSIKSIINHLFKTNQENPSKVLRNTVHLLNQITSYHAPFNSLSIKNSLRLGDSESARNLLLETDPSDKSYLNNMMLAALFDTNINNNLTSAKIKDESVQLAVKNLMSNHCINQAVDILLITNKIFYAAETLFNFGKSKDAYQILMLVDRSQLDKTDSQNISELIQKIANSLISKKEDTLYGMKLLASFGHFSEMIKILLENLE